jgi:hypothetical protein
MNPGVIKNHTRSLGAPPGWDHTKGACGSLPIRDGVEAQGYVNMTSIWVPSPEEIACIVAGEPIYVKVVSSVHPAMAVGVGHGE